jgi:hypothetical protein
LGHPYSFTNYGFYSNFDVIGSFGKNIKIERNKDDFNDWDDLFFVDKFVKHSPFFYFE